MMQKRHPARARNCYEAFCDTHAQETIRFRSGKQSSDERRRTWDRDWRCWAIQRPWRPWSTCRFLPRRPWSFRLIPPQAALLPAAEDPRAVEKNAMAQTREEKMCKRERMQPARLIPIVDCDVARRAPLKRWSRAHNTDAKQGIFSLYREPSRRLTLKSPRGMGQNVDVL